MGKEVEGEAEGPGHRDVALELKRLGYEVLGLWEIPPRVAVGTSLLRLFQRVPLKDLAVFTRQLSMLVGSGVPLLEGLEGLQGQPLNRLLTQAVGDLIDGLSKGYGLSGSLATRPDVFSPMYVNMVKAGEVSGRLDPILGRLADFLERDYILSRRVQAALLYPALIFVVSLVVVFLMVVFVFPTFVSFFGGMNVKLPWLTSSLLAVTSTLHEPAVIVVLGIAVPFAFYQTYHYLSSTTAGNHLWANLVLRLPLIGRLQRDVILVRFCRIMGTLIDAGVPQMVSLEVTGGSIGNYQLQAQLREVGSWIKDEGLSLARALDKMDFFPKMCIQLMTVGEEAGVLPLMLQRLADGYDLDVKESVTRFTVILEPLMLTVMGFVVGYVLLAVFLPVYSLVNKL